MVDRPTKYSNVILYKKKYIKKQSRILCLINLYGTIELLKKLLIIEISSLYLITKKD